ncbi:mRNA-decapping enzyme subunit 2 [Saxophila tyrrhenica]|uniref:mRNA-decapping enzyme subunit 2 n=1 Tax=Saxophila tyrrhenica TaxID=1690608 RepID=A0AAV9P5E3_9PEZI|nr:mRNA-decapping enzyme subunit 2 [Saxophila tyrrhenica]
MTTTHHPTTLVDWLDDLTVRFLLNLPASELSSVPRLCFQVEEAQWFYEDFVRPAVAAAGLPPLPSLPLRQFCLLLFQHCPLLSGFTDAQHIAAYEEFLAYKVRVPVRGAIMLDEEMEHVLLVRGWKKGASWSFPRGKINKDEKDLDCAVREVYEETGYDAREAGLVPDNEDDAKFIDITMREQHMRLFVFRGVSRDTHFEPRTRKEIGGINWYAIKDLPGFKKQKIQHAGEGPSSSKFYMVAPFLGHLKKWIGQQRKADPTRAVKTKPVNGGAAPVVTEDETEVEEESATQTDAQVNVKGDLLAKLLGSGQTEQRDLPAPQPEPSHTSANDLLAMLRGTAPQNNGNQIPQTPLEQVDQFPREPNTPQPDHLRHPSLAHGQRQPPPPTFPLSPQNIPLHDQQRNASMPTPNIFGPGPNGVSQGRAPSFPNGMPPHLHQQQFQQRESMPGRAPGPPPGPHNGFFRDNRNQHNYQQPFATQLPQQNMQSPFQQPPPNAYLAQGPQGAIASGPAVPNASQLPPPRLNAQSMKLLDAFKSNGSVPMVSASTSAKADQRPTSGHQAALLGLLKKAPATQQSPAAQATELPQQPHRAVSPTPTDGTDRTVRPTERRPTLNEITRTLPPKVRVKSPPTVNTTSQPSEPLIASERERPKSRQLFDPSAPFKPQVASPERSQQSLPSFAQQHPATRQPPKSPRGRNASPASSPSRKNGVQTVRSHQQPSSPFTILARPGSAREAKSPAAPTSPLLNEGPQTGFRPQVLKRSNGNESADTAQQPADKKDQLLALFGKTAPSARSTPSTQPASTGPNRPSPAPDSRKNSLLDLFSPPAVTSQQPTPTPAPAPPPAPRIEPERRPSSKAPPQVTSAPAPPRQQNLLLDLFNNKTNTSATPVTSPGTPISPFTLGTPATTSGPSQLPGMAGGRTSRLASVSSPDGSGSESAKTPTEAKEFLMGFLNGVVQEGYRGATSGAR